MKVGKILALTLGFFLLLTPFLAFGGNSSHYSSSEEKKRGDNLSNGWTHRPIVEHFTGLSCSPCMNVAHPDLTRLWEEEGYTAEQPWTYVEWHEYNGGHVDDLATEDTKERMRFYQPGVSATPCADVDGGYVECGGAHQSNSCDYETVKQALHNSSAWHRGKHSRISC